MAPVVVGEKLTADEAATVAQMYTEYGMQVSITDSKDQYVDLSSKANTSVFDKSGNLLSSAVAIIGALTVANRIKSYRRYKKPSLLERLFHVNYKPQPPKYHRSFRPRLEPQPLAPRRTIRRPEPMPVGRRPAQPSRNSHSHGQPPRGPGGPGRKKYDSTAS